MRSLGCRQQGGPAHSTAEFEQIAPFSPAVPALQCVEPAMWRVDPSRELRWSVLGAEEEEEGGARRRGQQEKEGESGAHLSLQAVHSSEQKIVFALQFRIGVRKNASGSLQIGESVLREGVFACVRCTTSLV